MKTGTVLGLGLGAAAVAGGGYLLVKQYGGSLGLNGGGTETNLGPHANAVGGSVALNAPGTGTVGSPVTLTASASGITSPVYQFWYLPPGQTWQQSTGYTSSATYAFTPTEAGQYDVIAYARPASAPSNESTAQRAQYEANSQSYTVTVSS
ncbi:MAG: hypothetical protein M0Z85_00115 [Gammaproteobacteria bacterium]|nr:hypothetical protein [Gammaproteobacteria bacterium]